MMYGYCRISRRTQDIERQVRNISKEYPEAHIVQEVFTGRKLASRPQWERLRKALKSGDTVIFDSVSRMSRNTTEGVECYEALFNEGINLVFLKEPYINTETYKAALKQAVPMTGTAVDCILKGVNEYLMILARDQVKKAFEQAQKEVDDLSQRTKEGLVTAKLNGKQIGSVKGSAYTVKKSLAAKEAIKKHNKTFGGALSDTETMKLCGISRNSFYKYKRELIDELGQ
ncbi:MAG: recombinase family protein [Acidaminococcaceae bacterium]|nr:recombinase family protein [Acidaminococcaceae bacterium]